VGNWYIKVEKTLFSTTSHPSLLGLTNKLAQALRQISLQT